MCVGEDVQWSLHRRDGIWFKTEKWIACVLTDTREGIQADETLELKGKRWGKHDQSINQLRLDYWVWDDLVEHENGRAGLYRQRNSYFILVATESHWWYLENEMMHSSDNYGRDKDPTGKCDCALRLSDGSHTHTSNFTLSRMLFFFFFNPFVTSFFTYINPNYSNLRRGWGERPWSLWLLWGPFCSSCWSAGLWFVKMRKILPRACAFSIPQPPSPCLIIHRVVEGEASLFQFLEPNYLDFYWFSLVKAALKVF